MPLARSLPLVCSVLALAVSVATAAVVATGGLSDWRLIQGDEPAAERRSRVQFPTQVVEEGEFTNHMVSLAFNWQWDADSGWSRPDPSEPSVALTLESWYRGLAELNLDMRPPRSGDRVAGDWPGGRAMGFAAHHDGSYSTLSLGGAMFNAAGAGLKLTAGTTAEPVMLLTEGRMHQPLLEVRNDTGVPTVSLLGGPSPSLAIGLAGEGTGALTAGVLRFTGALLDQPLINVVGVGSGATLLASQPDRAQDGARFRLDAAGRMEWQGPGDGRMAALAPTPGGVRLEGELAAAAVRLGGNGTLLSGLWATQAEIAPATMLPRATAETRVRVPGLRGESTVLASGPIQPAGIVLAGARSVGPDELALSFVNVGDAPQAPATGRYTLLVLEVELQ